MQQLLKSHSMPRDCRTLLPSYSLIRLDLSNAPLSQRLMVMVTRQESNCQRGLVPRTTRVGRKAVVTTNVIPLRRKVTDHRRGSRTIPCEVVIQLVESICQRLFIKRLFRRSGQYPPLYPPASSVNVLTP